MTAYAGYLIATEQFQLFGIGAAGMINALWLAFLAYWLISALKRKKTKARESFSQRIRYMLPLLVGCFLIFGNGSQYWRFDTRFVRDTANTQLVGVLLIASGLGFACWARYHLGENWSGVVTLKEGHELIRTGPYRNIRHPIYTGMLLGLLGTAIAIGTIGGLIGFVIAWASFYAKARREESFLAKEFGASFTEHQRHTGMFLPHFS
jgi:protein-S-isoprenylcysteine O-methyltransferase Ste14